MSTAGKLVTPGVVGVLQRDPNYSELAVLVRGYLRKRRWSFFQGRQFRTSAFRRPALRA